MPQLMREEVNLVLYHVFGRQVLYTSGVMTSQSVIDGVSVGEYLGQLTAKDIESSVPSSSGSPNKPIEALMKAVDSWAHNRGSKICKEVLLCYDGLFWHE